MWRQTKGVKNGLHEVQSGDDLFLQAPTVSAVEAASHWRVRVNIEGRKSTCKLEPGANCWVISSKAAKKLPNKPQQTCCVTLTAFVSHGTTVRGKIRMHLFANSGVHEESFFVQKEMCS